MKVKAKLTTWNKVECGLLAIFLSEDNWEKEIAIYKTALDKEIVHLLKSEKFTAKFGAMEIFSTFGAIPASFIMFIGLGKVREFDLNKLRQLAAKIGKLAKSKNKAAVAVNLNSELFKADYQDTAKRVTEGLILGSYEFAKYKSQKKNETEIETEISLLVPASRLQHVANGIRQGLVNASATTFARDLVNESPTVTTPSYLAQIGKNLAKKDNIKVDIFEEKEARKMGMHAYLSVSRGSSEPPKFIVLTYNGGGKKKLAVIGKSITFDTGGLSLKDAKSMETMKIDMSGGAAILGLFKALTEIRPKTTIYGILPATENMPGSRAIKPGDVVTAANGKSIEILNTDAEGRMTLADALVYAENLNPDYIIDVATLTGACQVALGQNIAGLWGTNTELLKHIKTAANIAGEKVWDMPLEEDYREDLKSDVSDLRNISKTRWGGAITAALFLQEFVEKTPWAHLDIAGPAWEEKGSDVTPRGGTGFGVRTLIELLRLLS